MDAASQWNHLSHVVTTLERLTRALERKCRFGCAQSLHQTKPLPLQNHSMRGHATLNKAFRTIWNQARQCFMAVAECVRSKGGGVGGNSVVRAVTAALIGLMAAEGALAQQAYCLPDGNSLITVPTGGACSSITLLSPWALDNQGTVAEVTIAGFSPGANFISNAGTVNNGIQFANGSSAGTLTGSLVNSGMIAQSGGRAAIDMTTSSRINGQLLNTGLIESTAATIRLSRAAIAGGISNTGSIMSYAANSIEPGVGIYLKNGAVVSNGINNAGTIYARGSGGANAVGVYLKSSTVNGSVTNSGLIKAEVTGSAFNAGIHLSAGSNINGSILNSGSIAGGKYGIFALQSSLSGNLTNSGTISGGEFGVYASQSLIDGSIRNSGSIGAGYFALEINQSTVNGGVENSGNLVGGSDGIYAFQSALNGGISNSDNLVGGSEGIYAFQSTISGGISNSGAIQGGPRGIYTYESALSGGLTNSGSISGSAYGILAIFTSLSGGISNLVGGSISGAVGVGIGTGSTLSGGLLNRGYISSINNQGLITATGSAIVVEGGVVANGLTNSGLIQGFLNGAALSGQGQLTGGIRNTSTIVGGGGRAGINLDGTSRLTGGVFNSGLIQGGSQGISVWSTSTLSGGVTNTGVVIGANGQGINIGRGGLLAGGFNNQGTISGGALGLALRDGFLQGGLTNSGVIKGGIGIGINSQSQLQGGISNTGLIAGLGGTAISNLNLSNTLDIVNTVSGTQVGTIVGAIIGNANVSNAGLWALQKLEGSTIAAGTTVAASISGNYLQQAGGTLQIGVNGTSGSGTTSGNYSTLAVSGSASFASNSGIIVSMSADHSVVAGGTLAGVVTAGSGITSSGFSISDNSALVNFAYATTSGSLDLVAVANATACGANITGSQQGPCEVAYDKQTISVASTGSIGGAATGIKVLTGAITAAGIVNAGTVLGSNIGINVLAGSTFTGDIVNTVGGLITGAVGIGISTGATLRGSLLNSGYISSINNQGVVTATGSAISVVGGVVANGITNSGRIVGGAFGMFTSYSSLTGGISNSGNISGGFVGVAANQSAISGGITNSGLMQGSSNAGFLLQTSVINGGILNQAGGTIIGAHHGVQAFNGSVINGGLTTAGLISGGAYAVYVDGASTLSNIVVTGNNTASFGGAVYAPNTPVTVAGGATYTLNSNFEVSNFANEGMVVAAVATPTITGNLSNAQSATLIGAIAGLTDVSNSGYLALQTLSGSVGSTISAGSHVNMAIAGNYVQGSTGVLSIGVNGTSGSGTVSGNYSTLTVGGAATFASGSALSVMLSSDSAVQVNGTLVGVVTAAGGLTAGSLNIIDNSALLGFVYQTIGGTIDLVAYQAHTGTGTISGSVLGPVDVAFDLPNLVVQSTGTISGGAQGANVLPVVGRDVVNGTIINQGAIYGNQTGIQFMAGTTLTGGVSNIGVINGVAGSGIRMVNAQLNGGLVNSGTISGSANGVYVDPSVINGGITNSGLMQGSSNAGFLLQTSVINGGMFNLAGGTINGAQHGVQAINGSVINGGLTTAGLISGGAYAVYVDGASTLSNIVVTGNNTASFGGAVYAPNTPVTVAGGAAYNLNSNFEVSSFNNQGTLIAPVASAATPTIVGNLTLGSSGTFSPTVASQSDYTHLTVSGNVSLGGVLSVNAATISGSLTAGSTLAGIITGNSVSGSFGSYNDNSVLYDLAPVYSGTALGLTIANATASGCHGTLTSNQSGPCLVGYDAPQLVNTGYSITGAAAGIQVLFGNITNSGTGVGITNSGLVSGGQFGIEIQQGSTLQGTITNSGSIEGGGAVGIYAYQSSLRGGVNNSGSIAGGINGIFASHSNLSDGIANSGSIVGGSRGIFAYQSSLSGGINNSGSILGGTAGIHAYQSSLTGGISNSGKIAGGEGGNVILESHLSGGISNNGIVVGSVAGLYALQSSLSGGLTNSGSISGEAYGIVAFLSSFDGGISNLVGGSITGAVGVGIGTGSTLSGGLLNSGYISSIDNQGVITATGSAISVVGGVIANGITNSGLIAGGINAIYVDGSSSVDRIVIAGNNTASFGGAVYAPNTPVTVAGGATYTLNSNFTVNNFANEGLVVAASVTPIITGNLSNAQGASIIGAIAGLTDVSNSGHLALQTLSGAVGSTISAGSHVNMAIAGNYVQDATGKLSVGVNGANGSGTASGNYSQLTVGGTASLIGGSVNVSMNQDNAVLGGGILAGVVTANQLTATGLTITDNSALVDFTYNTSSGSLNLVALSNPSPSPTPTDCPTNVTGSQQGPCEVAFDNQTMTVAATGSIGGAATAIKVLTGAITAGGIVNAGTVLGSSVGINVLAGSTFTGNITNSGLMSGAAASGIAIGGIVNGQIINTVGGSIGGGVNGIALQAGSNVNGIVNAGTITGGNTGVSVASGASLGKINNLGSISNVNNAGILSNLTNSGSLASVNNTGTLSNLVQAAGTLHSVANSGVINGIVIQAGQVDRITNTGLIAGGQSAISVSGGATLANLIIAGNNTASFGGAVYAPNTPVTVAGGATYTLNSNFIVNNFTNQGTVVASIAAANNTTITGNYTQGSNGSLAIEAASTSSYGKLNVSGLASFGSNASIQVVTISGASLTNGNTLVGVVNAGSLSASTFKVTDNSALLDFSAAIVGNRVDLCAYTAGSTCGSSPGPTPPIPPTPTPTTAIQNAVASTGNNAGMGAAVSLDTVLASYLAGSTTYSTMNPVMDTLVNMPTNQAVSNAVSQTLPVLSGATTWNTMSVLSGINRIIEARHLKNKGISAGHDFTGNDSLWMKPFGTWTDQGNQNGAYGFKGNTGGLMLGGDTLLSKDVRAGLGFAWGNSTATSNASAAPQSQTSNLYQFIGYGSYALTGNLEANFQANGGWNSNNSNRQISFMGTSAQGSYSSAVWHVGAGLSNPYQVTETTQLIPSARFDYTWIRNAGYSETGASNGLGLNVNAETYQTSILGVDGKIVQKLSDHNSVNANLGVGYNFSPTQTWVAAAYQGAPSLQFTANGVNPGAVMGRAGVGYTYKLKENVDVGIRYDIDFQSQYTNQTATAKAKWLF